MRWHELSWPELDGVDPDTPVIIPLGSCEQHGHHLPLFVDTMQVTAIADRVEQELADKVLLTPTLWLGSSHHHKDFPGTISVLPSLYGQMIQEVARSVLRAGLRRLFFLNGHGGNRVPAANALGELVATDDNADDAYLALGSWWEVGSEAIKPDRHGMTQPVVAHACEYETSFMLVLRPDLVDMDRICTGSAVLDRPWYRSNDDSAQRVAVFRRFHRLTADGPLGRPEDATAAKGQSIFDAVTDEVVGFLRDFAGWPALPVLRPGGEPSK